MFAALGSSARRSASIGLLAMGAAVLFVDFASAEAALYVAIPEKGLRDGFAYGMGNDYPSEAVAKKQAEGKCVEQAKQYDVDPGKCRYVGSFKGRCAAVAMDTTNRWAGWGISENKSSAEKSALAECKKGASKCEVTDVLCDTK